MFDEQIHFQTSASNGSPNSIKFNLPRNPLKTINVWVMNESSQKMFLCQLFFSIVFKEKSTWRRRKKKGKRRNHRLVERQTIGHPSAEKSADKSMIIWSNQHPDTSFNRTSIEPPKMARSNQNFRHWNRHFAAAGEKLGPQKLSVLLLFFLVHLKVSEKKKTIEERRRIRSKPVPDRHPGQPIKGNKTNNNGRRYNEPPFCLRVTTFTHTHTERQIKKQINRTTGQWKGNNKKKNDDKKQRNKTRLTDETERKRKKKRNKMKQTNKKETIRKPPNRHPFPASWLASGLQPCSHNNNNNNNNNNYNNLFAVTSIPVWPQVSAYSMGFTGFYWVLLSLSGFY